MSKELPYAITPDGQIIQIVLVDEEFDAEDNRIDECDKCYCRDWCNEMHRFGELVGVDCTDYDDFENYKNSYAIWRKVDE